MKTRALALGALAVIGIALLVYQLLPTGVASAAGSLEELSHRLPVFEPRSLHADGRLPSISEREPDVVRPEDLERGGPVQLTQDVLTVGARLKGRPPELFAMVRDNVVYEPYYGAKKGSFETSLSASGNDVDQAALVIALWRAAGIPARFVRGVIEISEDQARNWLRVDDGRALRRILEKTGLPHAWQGDRLQLEHFWIKARLAGRWQLFDPSFKEYRRIPGIDLGEVTGIDAAELTAALDASGFALEASSAVPALGTESLERLALTATDRLAAFLAARPGLEWQDLFGGHEIVPCGGAVEIPYRIVRVLGEHSQLPEELQYRVTLRLGDLEHTDTTANLNRRRTTLHYLRQGEDLVPRLLVSKREVARGSPVAQGSEQRLEIELAIPGQESERVSKTLRAGAYYAFGFDLSRIPDREIFFRADMARRVRKEIAGARLETDNLVGELLFGLVKSYFYRLDKKYDETARATGLLWLRQPSLVVAGLELGDGEPQLTLDLLRDVVLPVSTDGDAQKEKDFMLRTGFYSSTLEASVIEDLSGQEASSAGAVLEQAQERGIPLFYTDSDSWSDISPRLGKAPGELRELEGRIREGFTVLVAGADGVPGAMGDAAMGYAVLDRETWSADFRLETLNGGVGAAHKLIETLIDLPNPVDHLEKILVTDDFTQALSDAAAAAGREVPAIAVIGKALDVYDQAFQRLSLFGAIGGYYTGKIQAPPIAPILGGDLEELKRAALKKVVTDSITKHLSLATSFGPRFSNAPSGKVVISIAYGLAFDVMNKVIEQEIARRVDEAFQGDPAALRRLDRLVDGMLDAGLALRLSELYQRFVVMPSLFGTPGIVF